MKHITFHLDMVSPWAWLAFERMPEVLEGLSYTVAYRPVRWPSDDHLAPADHPEQRIWRLRHAHWLAQSLGVALDVPADYPFDPTPLLRLALQCSDDGCINRFVAGTVLRHVWQGGQAALEPGRLNTLRQRLQGQLRIGAQATERAQAWLRAATDEAARAQGLSLPAWEVDGKWFHGLDSLPMLRAYLAHDPWFEAGHWEQWTRMP